MRVQGCSEGNSGFLVRFLGSLGVRVEAVERSGALGVTVERSGAGTRGRHEGRIGEARGGVQDHFSCSRNSVGIRTQEITLCECQKNGSVLCNA